MLIVTKIVTIINLWKGKKKSGRQQNTCLLRSLDDFSTTCFRQWIEPTKFFTHRRVPDLCRVHILPVPELGDSSIGVILLVLTSMVNAECPAKPVNEGCMGPSQKLLTSEFKSLLKSCDRLYLSSRNLIHFKGQKSHRWGETLRAWMGHQSIF